VAKTDFLPHESSQQAGRFRYNVVEFNQPYAPDLLAEANSLAVPNLRHEFSDCGDRSSDAVVHADFDGELRNFV
jgi:hypothetical protein